jgi:hypothetical protein
MAGLEATDEHFIYRDLRLAGVHGLGGVCALGYKSWLTAADGIREVLFDRCLLASYCTTDKDKEQLGEVTTQRRCCK